MICKNIFAIVMLFASASFLQQGDCLWCYHCESTQPSCGSGSVSEGHYPSTCLTNEKCVKMIEKKGANNVIIRNCLNNVEDTRGDVPSDKSNGCRPTTKNPRLTYYANNSIKDVADRRHTYDQITWCFCDVDHFCNEGFQIFPLQIVMLASVLAALIQAGLAEQWFHAIVRFLRDPNLLGFGICRPTYETALPYAGRGNGQLKGHN